MLKVRKNSLFKRAAAMMMAAVMLITSGAASENSEQEEIIAADETAADLARDFDELLAEGVGAQSGIMSGTARTDLYQYYFDKYRDAPRPDEEVVIDMSKLDGEPKPNEELNILPEYDLAEVGDKGKCLIWKNDLGIFSYKFKVPKAGMYNLEFLYKTGEPVDENEEPLDGNNNAIELDFKLNGDYPFSAARGFELDKYWQNEGVIEKDKRGHEQLPLQRQLNDDWITYKVKDKEGMFNEPYFFYLKEGENTISIDGIKVTGVAFKSMTFRNYAEIPSYADIKPSQADIESTPKLRGGLGEDSKNDIKSDTILMQGETPYWRSSLELGPTADKSTYMVNPHHSVYMRYNTMGGNGTWRSAGQSAKWKFSVPADGYYRFSVKVKQSTLRGFRANRRVLINDEVPVKEFEDQKFEYSSKWQQKSFTDENGEDIYIFLNAGENSITLEAVPGEIGVTMQRLNDYLYSLNYLYRRILMVVGPNPDQYNDYRLDDQIPELMSELRRIRDALREEKRIVERHMVGGGSEASTLETLAVIIDRCIDNPDRIPLRMDSLKDNIAALSAWTNDASRQPIELDYIEVATAHEDFAGVKVNFFRQLLFLWEGFIGSFVEDYTKLDGEGEGGSLNVWVGLGRDQALVLKNLLGDYNRTNDVAVSLNLVQGGILEASLAGKGPEVALFIGGDFPIQLAARDMTVDISKYPEYQQIVDERFVESLPTFFTYLDGVYGLPLTQMFPMMFYREDILEDLHVTPPETWDEFVDAIAVLNRAFLEIGLLPPLNPAALGSTIFEPGEPFTMLQLQTGQNFYIKDEATGMYVDTTFDSEASIDAFTMWTKFYTVYQFEQTYDPFTRFRTGQMPIVIMPYGFFNQLNATAPEIRGLWNFRHVPGTPVKDADGNPVLDENGEPKINIAASSGATCGLIFNKAADHDAAWEFLKWLTSDDIQSLFGQNMESMLGPLGRYETANKNALENLAWTAGQLERLKEQRDALVEIPMIPANYSATRHIKNAFRAVVNDNYLPRFALNSYNRDIRAEMLRKNAELESHNK